MTSNREAQRAALRVLKAQADAAVERARALRIAEEQRIAERRAAEKAERERQERDS
jgi:hypothetical protein